MLIDSHFHYLKEEFDRDQMIRTMDKEGIDKIALMAEILGPYDMNPHLLPMKMMRSIMGKRIFLPLLRASLSTFRPNGIRILGEDLPIYALPDNESVFEQVKAAPDRFYGYVFVNPGVQTKEEMKQEIDRYKNIPGFCGVKTHPFYHRYTAKVMEPLFQLMQEYKKPLLIHMSFSDRKWILKWIKKYPDVDVILAHCAFPYFNIIWPKLKKYPNVYVDISNSSYIDADMARKAVDVLGADHVLYGSDGPYGDRTEDGAPDLKAAYMYASNKLTSDELFYTDSNTFLTLQEKNRS